MRPILFTIGSVTLRSYVFFLALSYVAMVVCSLKRAPRFGVTRETMLDVMLLIGLSMFLGSVGWFYLLSRHSASKQGLASIGGATLAVLMVFLYAQYYKRNFLAIIDAAVPGFLFIPAIGRAGACFLAGCCFGTPTSSIIGVVFPPEGHLSPYPLGTALWPTQLFAAGAGVIGLVLVLWLERRFSSPGSAFMLVSNYYLFARFIVAQFWYHPPSQVLTHIGPLILTVHHLLLAGLAGCSLMLWLRARKARIKYELPYDEPS